MLRRSKLLVLGYRWCSQFFDPLKAARAFRSLPAYISEWRAYSEMSKAESLRFSDSFPQLHDRTTTTQFDPHYFYTSAWAMRRVLQQHPSEHLDVGSHNLFAGLLSSVLPVTFLDYRPLEAHLPQLNCMAGSILDLPFLSKSVQSASCLHVAEHIGLGRYGDPLNPCGTKKAASELTRVLGDGGNLFFAVPVGRERVCFNAHKVHQAATVIEFFRDLELREFSLVTDDGAFIENAEIADSAHEEYGCGLFWFCRKS